MNCVAKLHGPWVLSSCSRRICAQAVSQALLEPGRQKISVWLAEPANARDWIVELPISV
ncbi:hypothetical protein D3C87_2008200 [compost metagenome]